MTAGAGFADTLAMPPARARCVESTRTPRGWEMCHRDEHPASQPHHVKDRSWFTDDGPTPRLRLGQPCGETCGWPEYVIPYLGTAPNRGTGCLIPPTKRTKRWPPAQTGR